MQIQHKRLDVSCASVSLLGIVKMLQAVDWGPPASHVASYADSSGSDRSVGSCSTRADASGSTGSSETHQSYSQQSRAGSCAGFPATAAANVAGSSLPVRSSGGGGSGGNCTLEKLGSGLGITGWTGGLKRQLVVHVPPEAEFVHADGDRLLQACPHLVLSFCCAKKLSRSSVPELVGDAVHVGVLGAGQVAEVVLR